MPQALLINPPIYDFAAYDFWLKPLGLLSIAAILKKNNITVQLLDYLDRNHPALPPALSNEWGCGHYIMQEIPKPALLKQIPRQFKRYGMPADTARGILQKLSRPDVILVTSGMTYWYPGVQEAINEVKQIFPGVPVILGGIYATLCREHAERNSGADTVIPGSGLSGLKELLARLSVPLEVPRVFDDFPEPAYELYHKLDYVAIRTTVGCPFRCSYCAIQQLAPQGFQRKRADRVLAEIETLAGRGIKNIAFYDDALLFEAEQHIIPILEGVKKKGLSLSFHSPNGLHARFITPELARLLKETGFVMPRLSLETVFPERQKGTGGKVTTEEFQRSVRCLREAGYARGEYASYIMVGMPGQDLNEVEETVRFAHENGAKVSLAEYSIIPGTRDAELHRSILPSTDPLWHNKSLNLLPGLAEEPRIQQIKETVRRLNASLKRS